MRGVRAGTLAGIEIWLDWSLLIIFALITLGLTVGLFPAWHPDWGPLLTLGTGVGAAVLFLASILLHELSHAVVGRSLGIPVGRITLFVFGGMSHMEEEPKNWKAELWVAVAGPAMSLALGALFLLLAGQAVAWLLIASGFAMILGMRVPVFGTGLIGGLWIALIGWFLNNAAMTSYQRLVRSMGSDSIGPVSTGVSFESVLPASRATHAPTQRANRSPARGALGRQSDSLSCPYRQVPSQSQRASRGPVRTKSWRL